MAKPQLRGLRERFRTGRTEDAIMAHHNQPPLPHTVDSARCANGAIGAATRIGRLRECALNWHNEPNPEERGWAIMRAYDRFSDDAPGVRLAKGVAEYLCTQTLTLDEGDLLSGRLRRTVQVHPGIHEGYEWVNAAMLPEFWPRTEALDGSPVAPAFIDALHEWRQRHPGRTEGLVTPENVRRAVACGVFAAAGLEGGHRLPRFQMLLEHGAVALRNRARPTRSASKH